LQSFCRYCWRGPDEAATSGGSIVKGWSDSTKLTTAVGVVVFAAPGSKLPKPLNPQQITARQNLSGKGFFPGKTMGKFLDVQGSPLILSVNQFAGRSEDVFPGKMMGNFLMFKVVCLFIHYQPDGR
jgi:hypothetical protein